MEDLNTSYEKLNESAFERGLVGSFISLADAEAAAVGYWPDVMAKLSFTQAGIERVPTTEWREYLAATNVSDDRTPRERLADYFGVN